MTGRRRKPEPVHEEVARSFDVVPDSRGKRTGVAPPPGVAPASELPPPEGGTKNARRAIVVAALVALLVLATAAWWFVARSGGGDAGPRTDQTRQRTLLVLVTGAEGKAASSAVLGVDAAGTRAAALLIPSRLHVDIKDVGTATFGDTATFPGATASADALAALLGVRIDATWVLSPTALAALVDRVGGVQADVDVDVLSVSEAGDPSVAVAAGPQKLDGAKAAAYATFSAEGEPEQARLARFNEVLGEVLRRLPGASSELAVAIASVEQARSSVSARELEKTLGALQRAAVRGRVLADVLPVDETATEGQAVEYDLDTPRARTLLKLRFASALVGGGPKEVFRVLVENGVGNAVLTEAARARLVKANFGFLDGGPAKKLGVAKTVVLTRDSSAASLARGREVAAALGVNAQPTESPDRERPGADLIVILGADFKP